MARVYDFESLSKDLWFDPDFTVGFVKEFG